MYVLAIIVKIKSHERKGCDDRRSVFYKQKKKKS